MGTITEGGNYVDLEGGLYVPATQLQRRANNHSPAETKINQMRRAGTCVTAKHDLANAQHPVVPADPHNPPVTAAKLPEPKDPSMPDG